MYITTGVVVGNYVRMCTHTRILRCLLTIFGERDDFQHFAVTWKYL
jgi:hypothetical protein